ncbi:MAG: fused MFS/spermidine synthase [Pirellulaceae bacterium]
MTQSVQHESRARDERWQIRTAVYLVFFLSGVAALIYEISWSRQIGLLFGHTVHAASVVLGSYFAGMAAGYLIGAKLSTRVAPLTGYAVAELFVTAWAILIPTILDLASTTTWASWLSHSSFGIQTAVRAAFGFLLLFPATAAMGATLPFMANYFSRSTTDRDKNETAHARVTLAYAINTTGAFVGVSLATFYMLVNIGVRTSSFVAAAISGACALVAFSLSIQAKTETESPGIESSGQVGTSTAWKVLVALSFLCGFGTLALQVLYTRMFSLIFHNSTYTFGIVVAVFIVSLAAGAALAAYLQTRLDARGLFAVAAGMGAILAMWSVPVFTRITGLEYFSVGSSFVTYMFSATLLVTVIVSPPIICFGILLPLIWKMAGTARDAGRTVGRLTAVNTAAAAIGAITSSFLLLLWPGLWMSFVLIAGLFLVASTCLLHKHGQTRLAGIMVVVWLLSSVLVMFAPTEPLANQSESPERMIRRWNSPYGWIDLVQREETGVFQIRQNLHYRFGTTGSNAREYRQAHIPLLLHKNPRDVLFLGLGTGLTAGGAVPHPVVKNIVAVELIPQVVEAARMLADHNHNLVDHSRATIYIDDARHHLLAHDQKYDVIISDLFVPWESESGYLYTVEQYQVASQRLKPGGLFCQWLPLYQLGEREFESIANSFASVFPHTTIWWGQLAANRPVIALVGANSPVDVDSLTFGWRITELKRHLVNVDPMIANPDRFWDLYIGDWVLQPQPILNTDEHPRVEFLTPISHRNQQTLFGDRLEEYFDQSFVNLPAENARLIGEFNKTPTWQRRAWQRRVLFGD